MTAVITGASRGIGRAVAEIFALHGYNLMLTSKTESRLLAAVESLLTKYPQITIHAKAFDLSIKQQCRLCGEWVLNTADSIDVLVNNAGFFIQGNVSDEADGVLEEMLAANLFSAYHLTRQLLPRMKQAGSGHIFNICSIASLAAYPGGGAYSISKFALLGFTRNLRHELKTQGIKVTAVIPGATYTDSWKSSGLPQNRFMEAEDIARMILAASQLSNHAVAEDIILRPQAGDI